MNNSKYFKFIFILTALALGACAHHRDVRPGVDGIHRVVISAENTEIGNTEAIRQATNYCESIDKRVAFMDEKANYVGTMKEEDYKKAKTAAKVAGGVGSAAYIFGGKNESAVGGLMTLGAGIADGAIGNGYKVEMKFKCQ